MKYNLAIWVVCLGVNLFYAQSEPASLFQSKCGICHTIGGGKLIGPDLLGVTERRAEDWLLSFISSSQTMIKSGDGIAVALFKDFNEVIMPDPQLSDGEIKSILGYVAGHTGTAVQSTPAPSMLDNITAEDVLHGQKLFEGRIHFVNKGPSCMSCHNGLSRTFFNNNSYAKDISTSFANLGEAGVKNILANSPFPVMAQAFKNHPLTQDELRALMAFMKDNTKINRPSVAANGDNSFLLYGLSGTLCLLVLYAFLWYDRKERSVNHTIYNRQIKSLN